MKKLKVILGVICIMLLLVGCGKKKVDEGLSGTITIDINPSIEIEVKDNKANRISYDGEKAEDLVSRDFEGKPIIEVFEEIVKNAREKGYEEDGALTIILGIEDKKDDEGKDTKSFEDLLKEACDKNGITFDIIVPKITEEAKREAQGYGVSPAKAQVILETMKDNEDLHFDDLKDKSGRELTQMKETGLYCDRDYTLRGDKCERIEREEKPQEGKACPKDTIEYKGKCYEEAMIIDTDNIICHDGYTLKDKKCVRTVTVNAKPDKYTCSSGTAKTKAELGLTPYNAGDAKDIICVDESTIKHPVTPCEAGKAGDGTEYKEANGKCYWHRAGLLPEGCPGKVQVGGECWDDATGIYICVGHRDGDRYKDRSAICPGFKSTNPTVSSYKCDSGYTLDGNKCSKEEAIDGEHERTCNEGYTLVDNAHCLGLNNPKEKEIGLVCPKDARLEGERCVYYEVVDAKSK
jgi:hypothetical protein